MKSLRLLLPLSLSVALVACGGGKGSTAPAPTNFIMEAQDSQLHLSWDALPGVEYWVWCAPNASTVSSHAPSLQHSGWFEYYGFIPGGPGRADYYATSLTNGTPYACTVNGRYDKGAGGADASPQVATPKLLGSTGSTSAWSAGASTALSGMTVKSMAYGPLSLLSTVSDQFVAVGANGKIAVSTAVGADATVAWAAPSQATDVTSDFNAVTFYPWTSGYRFVAVGAGGKVAYALNGSAWAWTSATAPAPAGSSAVPDLNAVAAATLNPVMSTSAGLVAVGNSGYIALSSDGASWTTYVSASNTFTSNHLRGVVYVPASSTTAAYWIAVGDAGTILKSTDGGVSWSTITGVTQNLKSVAVLPVLDSNHLIIGNTLVAAGDQGLVYSGNDGATWTSAGVTPSAGGFVSVVLGRGGYAMVDSAGLMAVDATGRVYTSANGSSWSGPLVSGVSAPAGALRYSFSASADYKWLPSQSLPEVSHGWMVFDAAGNQRIAR